MTWTNMTVDDVILPLVLLGLLLPGISLSLGRFIRHALKTAWAKRRANMGADRPGQAGQGLASDSRCLAPKAMRRRDIWEAGDLAECAFVTDIHGDMRWAVKGPSSGEVRRVVEVRREEHVSADGQSIEPVYGLKFQEWPHFFNAQHFRRIDPQPDYPEPSIAEFQILMAALRQVVRNRAAAGDDRGDRI